MVTPSERPIFILASSQRCGSTLLQRLLNSCPDILIWGEQGGYLNDFLHGYQALLGWGSNYASHREVFFHEGYDHFVACMIPDDNALRNAAARYIIELFGSSAGKHGKAIWGFKEVRCDIQIAVFLQECFPYARFIHLTRNIVDCFISLKHWENDNSSCQEDSPHHWNRRLTEKSIDDWRRINASFLETTDRLKLLLSVRYEDMVADPDCFIAKLAAFLEIEAINFDARVFVKRLYEDNLPAGIDLRTKILPSELDAEERALLSRPDIIEIVSRYGYHIPF